MKNTTLYIFWAVLFVVCAGLGFIPEPEGSLRIFCLLLSLAFFVPPMVLIHRGDRRDVSLVRNLSALALVTALILLVLNILSASFPAAVGVFLHCLLVVAASPLICSHSWALILFFWAYLMIFAHQKLKKA